MSKWKWKIKDYRVRIHASKADGILATISFVEDGGEHRILQAYFSTKTELRELHDGGKILTCYFSYDQFSPMMDMLRNEWPIYVHRNHGSRLDITTHWEPVGEEESM